MKVQYVLTAGLAISPVHGFLLMNKLLAYERIDPIVQPAVVSSHLHAFADPPLIKCNKERGRPFSDERKSLHRR